MSFRVFAPASIGNVASGFDVLGLAVEGLGDDFYVEPHPGYEIEVRGRDAALVPLDPEKNTVTMAAEAFYRLSGQSPRRFKVRLERQLPLAGGLGSSAASSVAGALAAAQLCQLTERSDLILRAALYAESQVAGPHLDNIAPCFYGGLTLVQDTEALAVYPIKLALPLEIVLVTPPVKVRTQDARRVLAPQLKTGDWTKQMAHCSTLALALATGAREHLSFGLTDPFAEKARQHLIPSFLEGKNAALEAGAYGFSISGSGPTCFAVCADTGQAEKVLRALQSVFGKDASYHLTQPRVRGAEIFL